MKTLRRLISVALLLLGALFGLLSMSKIGNDESVARTLANNHVIHAHLVATASYVRSFFAANGRLPDQDDAERWKREAPKDFRRGATFWSGAPFELEVIERFGQPPQSEAKPFVISYWRGEWREYYASWKDATSLTFDRSAYYFYGSQYADVALHLLLAAITLVLAYALWPKTARLKVLHNDA